MRWEAIRRDCCNDDVLDAIRDCDAGQVQSADLVAALDRLEASYATEREDADALTEASRAILAVVSAYESADRVVRRD